MVDMEFEVSSDQAIEWAKDFRKVVEADPQDTPENRKRIFLAYLLFSFAETMQEEEEEVEDVAPNMKELN